MEKCRICGREFTSINALMVHMNLFHKMNKQEYYDKFLKKDENEGKCLECGKPTKFDDATKGYRDFCCVKCARNNARTKERLKNTILERYGTETTFDNAEIREKAKNTFIERYGVDNPLKIEVVKEKVKKTNLEKYGVECTFQSEEVKEKIKQTNLERYGVEYSFQADEVKDKIKETLLEHYGVEYPGQSEEIKEKIKQTNLKRYGVEYATQSEEVKEKTKETNLEKYGVECSFQSEEVKEKIKQTVLERYGVEKISQSKEIQEKTKQTMLERYGVDCIFQRDDIREKALSKESLEKIYDTKKKNNSFPISKTERELETELRKMFPDLKTQYKSKDYPFSCDYYIPSLDLYIEYNGTWMHENHFFDKNNREDIEELNRWIEKSKNSTYYKSAINIWTNRDVLKLETAIQNNLNYVAWFNKEQAYDWIESQRLTNI